MPPAVGPAFAAAQRVGDGVLRLSSDVRSAPEIAFSAGLAETDILIVGIAQPTYRGATFLPNHPHLAAWQDYGDPVAFFGDDFCGAAGDLDQLSIL
jgi:hypothetical protein